ncbi:MAG: PilZ domain-containing protein, partial [Nitrospirales bacterium]
VGYNPLDRGCPMVWPDEDNRQHVRVPYERPVRYRPMTVSGLPRLAEPAPRGQIINISNGGMAMRTEGPTAAIGSILTTWVPLCDYPVTIPIPSVVTRVKKEDHGLYFLGLRFLL